MGDLVYIPYEETLVFKCTLVLCLNYVFIYQPVALQWKLTFLPHTFNSLPICCCSLRRIGRITRRHPATSSRIFFPLHLFSARSCHRLSTAEHRLSMLFFFSQENIFLLFYPQFLNCSQNHAITSFPVAVLSFKWNYLLSSPERHYGPKQSN